jgi:O-antigen ligase
MAGMSAAATYRTTLAVALLALGAIGGPIAIGGTGDWSRLALETVMATAVVLWAIDAGPRPWALLRPVAVASLVLLQLMPLPDRLLTTIAPVSAGAWKISLQGNPDAWGRISIDPAATAMAGRRLLLGLATVAAVADLARNVEHRRRLTYAIAASGVVIVALSLIFPVDKDRRVLLGFFSLAGPVEYWRSPVASPVETSGWAFLEWVTAGPQRYLGDLRVAGDGFGSYIISNHFAGAVSLTLPVTLAVCLWLARGRVPAFVRYAVAAGMVAAGVWLVGPMAGSRAGFGSLLLAGLALLALCVERLWAKWAAGLAVGGYAAALLAFVIIFLGQVRGVTALVPESMRPRVVDALSDGRVVAAGAAARMFRASPLLGTGLSTYGDLYPRLMQQPITWYYAHNDYAQLLAETGLVGLGIAAALAYVLIGRLRRFLREAVPPQRLLDAGPWAALAGIAAHSAFDWNLHVPANAFLACLVAGLAAASGAPAIAPNVLPGKRSWRWLGPAARIALVTACMGSLVLLARDAWSSQVGKQMQMALVANAKASRDPKQPNPEPLLAAASKAGESALELDPGNPRLALLLGQAELQMTHRLATAKPSLAEASLHEAAAEAWFARARRQCALCRGLPEPLPPVSPK